MEAYSLIFDGNASARALHPWYINGFAGTGYRVVAPGDPAQLELIPELGDDEIRTFVDGSARIALEVEPAFERYLFIDRKQRHSEALAKLRQDYPGKSTRIIIENADANAVIKAWCARYRDSRHRAVVLLDPYGMQVDWSTLEAVGSSHVVDLWLLVPLGIALNRLLTKGGPPEHWATAGPVNENETTHSLSFCSIRRLTADFVRV